MGVRGSLLALWAACGSPDPATTPPVEDPPVDPPVDTPADPPDVPPDDPSDDPLVDPPDEPPPPVDIGGWFTDLAPDWAALDGFPVWLGDVDLSTYPQTTTSLLADVDHDGVMEWVAASLSWGGTPYPAELRVYRVSWATGILARAPALEADLRAAYIFAPGFMADIDGDGFTDALDRASPHLLARGVRRGFSSEMLAPPGIYNLAIPLDIDQDGLLDLAYGGSRCPVPDDLRSLDVAFGIGDGQFGPVVQVAQREGGESRVDGILPMPAAANGGVEGLYLVALSCDQAHPIPGFYDVVPGAAGALPTLVHTDPLGSAPFWLQVPWGQGALISQVAPMGASLEDLDSDGAPELMVTIGANTLAVFSRAGGGWVDRSMEAAMTLPQTRDIFVIPWSLLHPDLDMDGRPEVIITYGDDGWSRMVPLGLPFQTVAWYNHGGLQFTNESAQVGLPDVGSWRGAVMSDVDCDGDGDLALGGMGSRPHLYRYDNHSGRLGLSLRLRGTTSNLWGVGAFVEVEVDGLPTRTMIMGGTGNADGAIAPELFAGLGDVGVARKVTVRWPSGHVQELTDVAGGRCLTIEEPPTISLATRHAPADGASTLEVTVTPRGPDGSLALGAPIALTIAGVPVPVARRDDADAVRFTLTAPPTPGSSVLTVTVDGVPLGVRPRVWWD